LWAKFLDSQKILYGQDEKLMKELAAEDWTGYRNFLKMDHVTFRKFSLQWDQE